MRVFHQSVLLALVVNHHFPRQHFKNNQTIWQAFVQNFFSINIEETIKISAEFSLTGRCNNQDSVDVTTNLWGGTPPYTSVWSNGDVGPNANNGKQSRKMLTYEAHEKLEPFVPAFGPQPFV
mgnify:CR=1 FL=1